MSTSCRDTRVKCSCCQRKEQPFSLWQVNAAWVLLCIFVECLPVSVALLSLVDLGAVVHLLWSARVSVALLSLVVCVDAHCVLLTGGYMASCRSRFINCPNHCQTHTVERSRPLSPPPPLAPQPPLPLSTALRLCTSAVITASQSAANPDNAHITIYQRHVQRVLPTLLGGLSALQQFDSGRSGLAFRLGALSDEDFWVRSVEEVLALEGTFVWDAKEEARQRLNWRASVSSGGATVAVDSAGTVAGFVTWERGDRAPYAPPNGRVVPPFLWIAVSFVAHSHRRQG